MVRKVPNLQAKKFEEIDEKDERSIKIEACMKDKVCFGGVMLANAAGNIVLNNTLDSRAELCFEESLPEIREMLGLNEGGLKDGK